MKNHRIPSRRYAYMEDGDEARDMEYEDFMGWAYNEPDENVDN